MICDSLSRARALHRQPWLRFWRSWVLPAEEELLLDMCPLLTIERWEASHTGMRVNE